MKTKKTTPRLIGNGLTNKPKPSITTLVISLLFLIIITSVFVVLHNSNVLNTIIIAILIMVVALIASKIDKKINANG
jgi:hypothetical protein